MSDHHLATYLNDHLAGAVAALELFEYVERLAPDGATRSLFAGLRADVAADRRELEALMGRLGVDVSLPRKAGGWLGEKFTELKLLLDAPHGGPLRLLEALDALSAGAEGKHLLWRALEAAAEVAPALHGIDYRRLQARAEDQRRRLETARLQAAREALAAVPA